MRSCLSCWQQNVTFFMLRAASSVPVLRSRQILEVVCRLSLSPMKIRVYNGNREVNSSQKEKHRASKRCPKFWYSANRGGTTPGFLFRQAISRQHLFNRLRLMMRFDRRARCCLQNGVLPEPGVFVRLYRHARWFTLLFSLFRRENSRAGSSSRKRTCMYDMFVANW